ncbi:MAG TPA: sugar transferase [Ktedonobacteraceae bacterium]|nr:sugar transferase [Ktedonobacteraceae bacterium]
MQFDFNCNIANLDKKGVQHIKSKAQLVGNPPLDGTEQVKDSSRSGLDEQYERRRPSRAFWKLLLISMDTVLIASLFTCVFSILTTYSASALQQGKVISLCFTIACWNFIARVTRAQTLSYASSPFRSSICVVIALLLLTFLSIVFVNLFIGISFRISLQAELLFCGVASPILVTWRVFFASLLNLPCFRQKAVIVGNDPASTLLLKELQQIKRSTFDIIGYICESVSEQIQTDDLPILGARNTLRFLIQHRMIDMVIMAVDYKSNLELFQEGIDAAQFGIAVIPIAVILESVSGKIPVKHIGDQWYSVLPLKQSVSPLYLLWGKVMDLVFVIGGLAVLLTLFPLIATLIYLESPGPIFYSQERLGFQGKMLRIYKFRSMYPNAERTGHAVWASKDDPRITRFGSFMRRTHLDELPQVFNILRGDMSLIGPRPEREVFVNELETTIPFYRCRLAVKPGLTGWAQVKYHYGNSTNDALVKLQYDLYYIKRRSFMLDIFIILSTVLEVLQRRGA